MKNLRNIEHLVLSGAAGVRPTACEWDVATNSLICAFGPVKDDALVQLKRWRPAVDSDGESGIDIIATWDSPCPVPDLDCDCILSLKHFSDTSTSCLVFAGGDIVVVRELPFPGEEKIEIVGSVEVGITAATWSPDEELLAIATKEDTFLYMTREFESVTSTSFTPEDLNASKHVDVGWGKAETQFKGRGAKALRDPTMPEKIDQGLPSSDEDSASKITWRGDGAFVAVNSTQATSRRVIRVYSREGVLDGVSEPIDYLESTLSWRPSGNILAGIQRLEGRIDVIFFERNGLRHGQFSLRLTKENMEDWGSLISLNWNIDSSVLAVGFQDRVQLWTMGNYHYYLKQEFKFSPAPMSQRLQFSWHPEQPLVFAAGSESLHRLEYIQTISKGSTIKPNDNGIVAVIDGRALKLTPFRRANIPPPMALHNVEVDSPIIDVAFSESSGRPARFAVLSQESIFMFHWDASSTKTEPVVQYCHSLGRDVLPGVDASKLQQISFAGADRILLLISNGTKSTIIEFDVAFAGLVLQQRVQYPQVQQLLSVPADGISTIYLGLRSGEFVLTGDLVLQNSTQSSSKDLPSIQGPIDRTELISLASPYNDDTSSVATPSGIYSTVAVSLTRRGALFAGKRCLATSCTSFLTTEAHLIFTTSQHLLKFVHISDSIEGLMVPLDTPEADERCRSIERGAKLVTAIPSTSALILQMPRGNLETIYPRALVLAEIRNSLKAGRYKKAFMSCRSHRVDMNILHDHNPQSFLSHVSNFVEQIRKVEHIDLFLSQLRAEDVSVKMYHETTRKSPGESVAPLPPGAEQEFSQSLKVNRICDAFLRVLRSQSGPPVQNIITAHCCKLPPDLESGLSEVSNLQSQSPEEAERAIQHICFLVDVNRLYDTALGLYDLDLTLLVAQQSQKDPREYLPFLQKLRAKPLLRMKFEIDDHLGRHVKCLTHFHELEAFEELKIFTIEHSLYEESLLLYRYQEASVREIMKVYADYLSDKSRFREAGMAYEYLKNYAAASEAYRLAHLWQEALSCANLVPLEADQMSELAQAIADSLVELKNYHAAATIHLDYIGSVESAARLFCRGYFFADAIRVLSLRTHSDVLESVVDAGLVEAMGATTELLAECNAQLGAQVQRIRELRIKKLEEPLAFFDADDNGGAVIPDNVSLAGTEASSAGGSLFTRYTARTGTVGSNATRRTSKNRRREERKKARGKKGSIYEEEYLVNSVGRLFDRINSANDEVSRLITGLMRRGMRERAKAVQAAMISIIEACKGCTEEIFQGRVQPSPAEKTSISQGYEEASGEGSRQDGMKHLAQNPPETSESRVVPMVKAFVKVSLLGN